MLTPGGRCRFHAVISIKKRTEGEAKNAIFAAFATQDLLKWVAVVDDDIDIYNPHEVERAISTRMHADRGIFIVPDVKSNPLDPASHEVLPGMAVVIKVGIDATRPLAEPAERYEIADSPPEILKQIKDNWEEYLPTYSTTDRKY